MNYLYVLPSARPNMMLSTLPAKQAECYSVAEAIEEVRHGSSMIDGKGTSLSRRSQFRDWEVPAAQ